MEDKPKTINKKALVFNYTFFFVGSIFLIALLTLPFYYKSFELYEHEEFRRVVGITPIDYLIKSSLVWIYIVDFCVGYIGFLFLIVLFLITYFTSTEFVFKHLTGKND